ncbi:MAG: D-alanine--D-alanine ligase [Deltaproteobacteria bacterium]|nr:MAG: D-alanine--D-alanine ligase [Deltaproteobacteria bacterium]
MGSRIGVLMGGLSTERDISLKSGTAVVAALRARGHEVVDIVVDRDLPTQLLHHRIDVAWIALHGRFGEDGCVQGLLEVMGIPYTGSGVLASAVCMDKAATKRALRGVPEVVMAEDVTIRRGESIPELPLPAVVKPAVGGSTLGIARVTRPEEAELAIRAALALDPTVLVEAFVQGPEITVAVLDGEPLPAIGIVPQKGFFDFEAKYSKGQTRYDAPAQVPDRVSQAAQRAAKLAYRALGCRGLARADFIVGSDDVPIFLEINTLPGMTPTSLSPMAAELVGIDFSGLCERILATAQCMEPEV